MFVDHLQLVDFRSYAGVDVPLAAGGHDAGRGQRAGQDQPGRGDRVPVDDELAPGVVGRAAGAGRGGAGRRPGTGAGRVWTTPRQLQLEIEITPGKANRARLNRSPLRRAREIVGVLRTVVFSPEDLAIVKGDPSERRRFLDDLLVTRWPRLAGVRADYDRVLRQRNTLLKSLSGRVAVGPPRPTPPPPWTSGTATWPGPAGSCWPPG